MARIVVNELDAARFDPLLVRAIAKNTATCLDNVLKRLENLVGIRFIFCPSAILLVCNSYRGNALPLH